uniref:Uncharacterized protein n=1 Tax=Arundo donax TaxID=35708 RepID=A0A0A9APB2_ARUDO
MACSPRAAPRSGLSSAARARQPCAAPMLAPRMMLPWA